MAMCWAEVSPIGKSALLHASLHHFLIGQIVYKGEEPATGIVAGITTNPGGTTLVTCVEDERLEFQVGAPLTHHVASLAQGKNHHGTDAVKSAAVKPD